MNTNLRLLVTPTCNRNCEGCCNKEYDLIGLPVVSSYSQYERVLITGGEPLLFSSKVVNLIKKIKENNSDTEVFVYTANYDVENFTQVLLEADGITLTLHEKEDLNLFYNLMRNIPERLFYGKSMRLNVFSGISVRYWRHMWKIKEDMVWIKNCPVPYNEDFLRLKDFFKYENTST